MPCKGGGGGFRAGETLKYMGQSGSSPRILQNIDALRGLLHFEFAYAQKHVSVRATEYA